MSFSKTDFDFEEEVNNTEEIKNVILDLEQVKKKIPEFSSAKLCEMIVCDRYFDFEKNIAVICMEELAKRRLDGDDFDFESHIDAAHAELPPLNFDMPDLRTILNQAIKQAKK
jgi:hypothetical protein